MAKLRTSQSPRSTETYSTASATSKAELDKSPNRPSPPLSLNQAEELVGIFNDRNDIPHHDDSTGLVGEQVQGSSTTLVNRTVISRIKEIVERRDEFSLTDYLRGEAAQTFVDVVHEALNPSGFPPRLRGKCLSALCRICGRLALLPRPLQISVCYNPWRAPQYSGGYADVWKGEYQGRPVAAKVLRTYTISDFDKIRKRFCKEVITWNALSHPNVLPLLGVVMNSQRFVMVSEWMENGNINEFVKTHRNVDRIKLLKEVTRGLVYMHDQGMIHGDLKGANILIDQDGHARLADFGLLTLIPDFTNSTTSNSFSLGGTIRWMSPELFYPDPSGLRDTRPTKQSDCYALGMVIYEVLSGQVPFSPFHCCIVIRKVIEGERPERPNGPEGAIFTDDLWQTLNRCWTSEPPSRPSARVVLECLESVSGNLGESSEHAGDDVGTDEKSSDVLQAVIRKILAGGRGGAEPVGGSLPTTPTPDRL